MKFLYVPGEPLTNSVYLLLRELYSNALIVAAYSLTEAGVTLGHNSSYCTNLYSASRNTYHLNIQDAFYEVVNNTLVITVLHPLPFPIIRYDTGDRVIIKENFKCKCGFSQGPVAIIGPRETKSSYKIGAFIFRREHVDTILQQYSLLFKKDFILYLEQEKIGTNLMSVPHLVLSPRIIKPHPRYTRKIGKIFEKSIIVAPNLTLEEAIGCGLSKPIIISYNKNISGQRIVPPEEIRRPFDNEG